MNVTPYTTLAARRPVRAPVDPNRDARRCPQCGARSGWQQLTGTNAGGWFHCWANSFDTPPADDLAHVCTVLCVGGAA